MFGFLKFLLDILQFWIFIFQSLAIFFSLIFSIYLFLENE